MKKRLFVLYDVNVAITCRDVNPSKLTTAVSTMIGNGFCVEESLEYNVTV